MKVKAAVLREYGAPMSIEELELEDPHEEEVLIKVLACGFCHSDVFLWEGNMQLPVPVVLGHEACGIVEKVGPNVTKVKPGDRVVAAYLVPCGQCYQCLRGHPHACEGNMEFFGTNRLLDGTQRFTDKNGNSVGASVFVGGFSTHTVIPEIGAIRIPDHIEAPPEVLCLLGCCVLTGAGSALNAADVHEGDAVGVWGCGGVGLNAVRGAAMRNSRMVIAVDIEGSKRDIAMEFGATHFIDSSKEDPVSVITELTGGYGLDFAMDATGDPGAKVQAWWTLRGCGKLIAIGIDPDGSTVDLNLTYMPTQRKSIEGAAYGNCHPVEDIPNMAELIDKGVLKTEKLGTRLIKLEDLDEARAAMNAHEILGRWVVKFD